jgi:KDO2-lipid IV(A) lauroyltransferase
VKSRAQDAIELAALRAFFALARNVGEREVGRLGSRVGDLLFDAIGIRREVTLANLRGASPEMNESERQRIGRSCYRHFATTAIEFARLPRLSPEERLRHCDLIGMENVEEIAAQGEGAILVTGHFGNWEWIGSILPHLGYPLQVVAGVQRNKPVGALIDEIRLSLGVGVLSAVHDLRGILQALSRREFLAMVADQDAGGDGIFVDFLGRPASTAVGPVRLARRFGVPILMGFARREPDGRLRIEFLPSFRVPGEGDEAEILRLFTARWSGILEQQVRACPEQWFWMHRRWKTEPRAAARGIGGIDR